MKKRFSNWKKKTDNKTSVYWVICIRNAIGGDKVTNYFYIIILLFLFWIFVGPLLIKPIFALSHSFLKHARVRFICFQKLRRVMKECDGICAVVRRILGRCLTVVSAVKYLGSEGISA